MANKELDLFKDIIPAIDMGIKELYDAAGDDGKKDIKGELWNLNRYISSIKGDREKQELAVFKTNEYYNKNWNNIGGTHHIKLQWQLLCMCGNTGKTEFHPWLGLKSKKDPTSKTIKLLMEIYPNMKIEEVETLARISTKAEVKELAKEHGYDKVDI